MEMLRSSFQAVGLSSGDSDNKSGAPSSAETIERLVSRLNTSTLLEDRRDACRALKGRYLSITFSQIVKSLRHEVLKEKFLLNISSNVKKVSSRSWGTSIGLYD